MSHPSESELVILKSLWAGSPQSARDLHEGPGVALGWSLSSTRTTLARMVAKGLLIENRATGVRVYAPTDAKTAVMAGLIQRFMTRVLEFNGPLPTSAFTGGAVLDAEDLAEIDAILLAAETTDDAADLAARDTDQ
jgi:BlaI family penicillinase repressor